MKPNDREKFKLRRPMSEKTMKYEELGTSEEYDDWLSQTETSVYWSDRTYQIGRYARLLGNLGIREADKLSDTLYW
jgi:hypothetical protein